VCIGCARFQTRRWQLLHVTPYHIYIHGRHQNVCVLPILSGDTSEGIFAYVLLTMYTVEDVLCRLTLVSSQVDSVTTALDKVLTKWLCMLFVCDSTFVFMLFSNSRCTYKITCVQTANIFPNL